MHANDLAQRHARCPFRPGEHAIHGEHGADTMNHVPLQRVVMQPIAVHAELLSPFPYAEEAIPFARIGAPTGDCSSDWKVPQGFEGAASNVPGSTPIARCPGPSLDSTEAASLRRTRRHADKGISGTVSQTRHVAH